MVVSRQAREMSNPVSAEYLAEWTRFSFAGRELPFSILLALGTGSFLLSGTKQIGIRLPFFSAGVLGVLSVRHTVLLPLAGLPVLLTICGRLDGIVKSYSSPEQTVCYWKRLPQRDSS
jgi:hypothetical protein